MMCLHAGCEGLSYCILTPTSVPALEKKKKKAVGLGTRDIAAQGTRVTGLPGLGTHSDDSPVAPAGDRSPLEAEVLPPSVPPKALLSGW